jgi:hypothetical protein
MTSSPHGLYAQGYTRATMAGTKRRELVKLESLVIAYQNDAVNTFPGLVHTARHITKVGCTRSRNPNRKGGSAQGMTHDWGEVVTR